MQRNCRDGHPVDIAGLMRLVWCSACDRFELALWARRSEEASSLVLIPEWTDTVRLQDDEWAARTISKYATGLAQTVRLMQSDADAGRMSLF